MRIVHFSDLHLGFRAFPEEERGWNLRERDVASALQKGLQEAARLRPDLVLFTGDLFHRPDPPSSALLTLTRGLGTLRALAPGATVLAIAGERDTPVNPADPGPLAVLDALPGIEAAAGAPRAVRFRELGVHALLVPHRATRTPPFPELKPDRDARWNVLLVRGRPSLEGEGVTLDTRGWDYVAVGGGHGVRRWADRVWSAGALERVGWDPWREGTEEKGFVSFDLARGEGEFHPIPSRPVVDLAPLRTDPGDPAAASRRLRHLVETIPGGIEGKLVRVRLQGDVLIPEEGLEPGLLAGVRRRAAHLQVELEVADGSAPEAPGRVEGGASTLEPGIHLAAAPTRPDLDLLVERLVGEGGGALERPAAILRNGSTVELLVRCARELVAAARSPDDGGGAGGAPDGALHGSPDGALHGPPPPGEATGIPDLEAQLRNLRGDAMEAEGEAEARMLEWARDRQEAETRLQSYRDRARELRGRIRALDDGEGECPGCGRALEDRRPRILEALQEEWEMVVQDGRWWSRRRAQLEDKPDDLRELEARAIRLQWEVGELAEAVERRRAGAAAGRAPSSGPGNDTNPSATAGRRWESDDPQALRPFVARAGSILRRWTEGRLSGLVLTEGGVRVVEPGGGDRAPPPGEAGAVRLALHLALWGEAVRLGRTVPDELFVTELDERGLDPLLPLLNGMPLDRVRVVVALPPGAPVPGHPLVRSLLVADGAQVRSLPAGPGTLRLDGASLEVAEGLGAELAGS